LNCVCLFDNLLSSAYWLFSGCNKIYALGSTSLVGSIGVKIRHVSLEEYNKKAGIAVTDLASGSNKLLLSDSKLLNSDGKSELLAKVALFFDAFKSFVLEHRPISDAQSELFDGSVFSANDAIQRGLIDGIVVSFNKKKGSFMTEVEYQQKLDEMTSINQSLQDKIVLLEDKIKELELELATLKEKETEEEPPVEEVSDSSSTTPQVSDAAVQAKLNKALGKERMRMIALHRLANKMNVSKTELFRAIEKGLDAKDFAYRLVMSAKTTPSVMAGGTLIPGDVSGITSAESEIDSFLNRL